VIADRSAEACALCQAGQVVPRAASSAWAKALVLAYLLRASETRYR
jgi:hypothetical protein